MKQQALSKVKKGWTENWFRTPNSIYEIDYISGYAKAVYIFLCRCADGEGQSFPGYMSISKSIGFGRTRTIEAIKELEASGLLLKENRFNHETGEYYSNLYTVIHPDDVTSTPVSPDDIPLSPDNIGVSPDDTPRPSYDIPLSPGESEVRSTKQNSPIKNHLKKHTQGTMVINNEIGVAQENTSIEKNEMSVCEQLQNTLIQKGIRIQTKTLHAWLDIATVEDVLYAAELALQEGIRNPPGYIGTLIRSGVVRVETESKGTKDFRYREYYIATGEWTESDERAYQKVKGRT